MSEQVVLELKIPEEVLAASRASGLLDTPDEEAFDRLTRLASRLLGVPVSLVSVIDHDRQYFKSNTGLKHRRETPLSHSFCQHVVVNARPLLVADARLHDHLKHNKAVPELKVIAYLGVPLALFGQPFASLCAIDSKPREWSEQDLDTLVDLAACVVTEVELRARTRELEAANADLTALIERQNQFLGMAAHDLRTPLTVALGYSRVLSSEVANLEGRFRRMAHAIAERCDFMRCLIDDILDVEAIKAGKLTMKRAVQPLQPILDRAISVNQLLAQGKGTSITQIESDPEARCDCDAQKLEQVLNNLLGNAIKYCPPGSQVKVRLKVEGQSAVIRVEDNGQGIAPEQLSTIFDPFQRGEPCGEKGTGLGLAIVQRIVEAHGGEVTADSQVGKGTTFIVRLPLAGES